LIDPGLWVRRNSPWGQAGIAGFVWWIKSRFLELDWGILFLFGGAGQEE